MKLLKFNTFLNESHTQDNDTFNYIFIDLIDNGFKLNVNNIFLSDDGTSSSKHPDQSHKKPGYGIKLRKEYTEFNFEESKKVMDDLEVCNDRLSEHGNYILHHILFYNTSFEIEYTLMDKDSKEPEVNNTPGFDTFVGKINAKWVRSYNKTTRSFNLKVTKDGIALSPINDSINVKSLLPNVKSFISDCVTRKTYMGGGPNWDYRYSIVIDGNNINIIYKERIDSTHF